MEDKSPNQSEEKSQTLSRRKSPHPQRRLPNPPPNEAAPTSPPLPRDESLHLTDQESISANGIPSLGGTVGFMPFSVGGPAFPSKGHLQDWEHHATAASLNIPNWEVIKETLIIPTQPVRSLQETNAEQHTPSVASQIAAKASPKKVEAVVLVNRKSPTYFGITFDDWENAVRAGPWYDMATGSKVNLNKAANSGSAWWKCLSVDTANLNEPTGRDSLKVITNNQAVSLPTSTGAGSHIVTRAAGRLLPRMGLDPEQLEMIRRRQRNLLNAKPPVKLSNILQGLPHPLQSRASILHMDALFNYNFLFIQRIQTDEGLPQSGCWGSEPVLQDGFLRQDIFLGSIQCDQIQRREVSMFRSTHRANLESVLNIANGDPFRTCNSPHIHFGGNVGLCNDIPATQENAGRNRGFFFLKNFRKKTLLLSSGAENSHIVYDTVANPTRPLVRLLGHSTAWSLAHDISQDDSLIATGSMAGDVLFWKFTDQSTEKFEFIAGNVLKWKFEFDRIPSQIGPEIHPMYRFEPPQSIRPFGKFCSVVSISFNGCESPSAAVAYSHGAVFLDLGSQTIRSQLKYSFGAAKITTMKWNPSDEHEFLTGDSEGVIRRWALRRISFEEVAVPIQIYKHDSPIKHIEWDPYNAEFFLWISDNKFVNVQKTTDEEPTFIHQHHSSNPVIATWNPDERFQGSILSVSAAAEEGYSTIQ
ncbi:hypothetical protein HDU76_005349, partial [Blyttiomyces sp. JEL0837]